MKVISKRDADKMVVDSLFNPVSGHTLCYGELPFCTGKYEKTPTEMAKVGLEVVDIPGVVAVYGARRSDSWGPYTQLRSIKIAK